jgi:hypothetical protein
VLAAVFIGSFTAAALLHRFTAVALVLCGVAMTTLVWAVIGANVRSPRRRRAHLGLVADHPKQLGSGPAEQPQGK